MKLRDFGENAPREWFQQILEWSRKKLTFDDNLDCIFLTVNIGTAETEIGHSLGRTPRYIIPVASFPNGIANIAFSREPTNEKIWLTRSTAGTQTLLLM